MRGTFQLFQFHERRRIDVLFAMVINVHKWSRDRRVLIESSETIVWEISAAVFSLSLSNCIRFLFNSIIYPVGQ